MRQLLRNKTFWMLALICVATLLPFIGLFDYHTKGEPRESIVAMTMLTDDNWILPRNSYGEIAYKPPFFHWCIAVVSALWGEVTEVTSRLPSAVALILMTLGGFAFYARRKGNTTALVAALVAYTSFELHRAGANCRVDMVLTACIVGATYGLYGWYERGMRGIPWTAILLMGLGTLTKGPIGSVLPCLTTGVFLLLRGVSFWRAFFSLAAFGLLSLSLYAAWFCAAWQNGGQELLDLIYEENIGRMTGTMTYKAHAFPWTFNVVTLVAGYVPWTLLLIIALFFADYRGTWHRMTSWASADDAATGRIRRMWRRLTAAVRGMDSVDLFAWVNVIIIFVFYCIPESKRSVYLMPMYPFIGYLAARWILTAADRRPQILRIFGGTLAVLTSLLFVAFVAVELHLIPESIFGTGRHAGQNIAMLHALEDIGGLMSWLMVLVPTVAGVCWWRWRKATGALLAGRLIILIMALYIALDGVYTPTVLNSKSVKDIAAEIDRRAPASEGRLYEFMELSLKVKGDPLHFFELNFYLGDRIGSFYYERPAEGFLLIPHDDAAYRLPMFEKEGYAFELCYQAPKRGIEMYRFSRKQTEKNKTDGDENRI